jgi:hypothetical protein
MKALFTFVFFTFLIGFTHAQNCGSLKVCGFVSDNPDRIRFLATADIPGGVTFYFTDNAWSSTTQNFPLIDANDIYTWTSPTDGVNVGSVILIETLETTPVTYTVSCGSAGRGMPGLSNNGEQVYVLTKEPSGEVGSITEADICFAIKFNGTGDMPPGRFVDVGDKDNASYKGTGDITSVLNWSVSNNLDTNPITFLTPSCQPASALPVILSSFKVTTLNQQNNLVWTTTSESNNSFFEIHRASDAMNFEPVGAVDGNGTSQRPEQYQFTDQSPKAGLNYYRLKQVDFDGTFEYSRIIRAVNDGRAELTVKSFPESKELVVSGLNSAANYKLVNMNGSVIKTGELLQSDKVISHKNVVQGIYILQIQNADLSFSKKILIE